MSDTTELMRRIEAFEAENKALTQQLYGANTEIEELIAESKEYRIVRLINSVKDEREKVAKLEAENKRLRERIHTELKEAHKLDLGGEATRIIIWAVLEENEEIS